MSKKVADKDIIVGLDIGTSKIAVVVGALNFEGQVEIIGIGTYLSTGLKKGVISNIDETVESIQSAIDEAELMSGYKIDSVFAGIAGAHIGGKESKGIVDIPSGIVTKTDVNKILASAKAIPIASDQLVLHALPKQYTIDGQSGIIEPLGMSGVRLETEVHIITGSVTAIQNIINCVEKCGLKVNEVVLEQLASSYAVLSEAEKESGVCLVDIGGGTTDIAVFTKGTIRHTSNIPIAGDHVTNDIAVFLRVSKDQAEKIKIQYSCANPDAVKPQEEISVPSLDEKTTRRISRKGLAEVVESRYLELLGMVQAELRRSGFEQQITTGGIVLTGGCSRIEGAIDVAESVFNMPVKIGYPKNVSGITDLVKKPNFATSVGLLQYGTKREGQETTTINNPGKIAIQKFIQWVKESF